jgi:hypothetical protein
MNTLDRLQLEKMITENQVEDCTGDIRTKRHSPLIKRDVQNLLELKQAYQKLHPADEFKDMCISQCHFLFNAYMDIFNKILKDEIDVGILFQLLELLRQIEDGEHTQHSGAYEVGKLMKTLYIDSALRRADKLNEGDHDTKIPVEPPIKITWKEYKTATFTPFHI